MPHTDIAVSQIVIQHVLFMHKNSGTNKDGVTVSEAALVFMVDESSIRHL